MLAWLDIPVDCRMSGEVNEDSDVRFTVGGSHDEFDIVFEPAALERFLRLGFDLLQEMARVNPRALATGDGIPESAPFAFEAEALRKLATLCDKADAAATVSQPM